MNLKAVLLQIGFAICACAEAGDFDSTGPCADGGAITYVATGPYKGRAFDLLALQAMRSEHLQLTAAEAPWIKNLDGPSDNNQLYRRDPAEVLIFSSCQPRNCNKASLSGVLDLRAGYYGLLVTENGVDREIGRISNNARAALKCVHEIGRKVSRRTSEAAHNRKQKD